MFDFLLMLLWVSSHRAKWKIAWPRFNALPTELIINKNRIVDNKYTCILINLIVFNYISSSVANFIHLVDKVVDLILYMKIWFEQISANSILTIWNITQNNVFSTRSLVTYNLQDLSEAAKLGLRRANCNFFSLPAKKVKYTGMTLQCKLEIYEIFQWNIHY